LGYVEYPVDHDMMTSLVRWVQQARLLIFELGPHDAGVAYPIEALVQEPGEVPEGPCLHLQGIHLLKQPEEPPRPNRLKKREVRR